MACRSGFGSYAMYSRNHRAGSSFLPIRTTSSLAALYANSGLEGAIARIPAETDRWTYWYRSENAVSQIDHILLSPALTAVTAGAAPTIERRGISFSRILQDGGIGPKLTHFQRVDGDPNPVDVDFRFERFPDVSPADYASDHCPVFLELP